MARASQRDKILDALEGILIDEGVAAVTLDAVCARAGVSKGGLLYHFDSRDALFDGLLVRLTDSVDAIHPEIPTAPAAMVAWYVDHAIPPGSDTALFRALLASARAEHPGAHDGERSLQHVFNRFYAPLVETVDATVAEHVQLVADGLLVRAMLGLPPPSPAVLAAIRQDLIGRSTASQEDPTTTDGRPGAHTARLRADRTPSSEGPAASDGRKPTRPQPA